jgi:hypothetical protein
MAVVYTSPGTGSQPVNTLDGSDVPSYSDETVGDLTIVPSATIEINNFDAVTGIGLTERYAGEPDDGGQAKGYTAENLPSVAPPTVMKN